MTFTAFDVLAWTIVYLSYFVVAKIVIRDMTLHVKEGIYITTASLLIAVLAVIGIDVLHVGGAISGATSLLLCMIYFYKIKFYSITKTTTLVFVSIFIIAISDVVVMIVTDFFFPYYLPSIPYFPLPIGLSRSHFIRYIPYILLARALSAVAAFLFTRATQKYRRLINQNDAAQVVLSSISLFITAVFVIVTGIWRNLGAAIEFHTWTTLPLFGVAIATLAGVILYARSLHERMALRQKEAEQEILRQYTEQIEQQQGIVSKMQHDIGNILSSMEGYLEKDDLAGLKNYFYTKIKVATAAITDNNSSMVRLANITIPEIKATLVGKLAVAQSAGIDTVFEANDKIDNISVDSVALVRMLGIIMDNAIEELAELGRGRLIVACYKTGDGVTFVVQNTCRTDIQNIHELEQAGFSTKGESRGLGLSNLAAITNAYPDNISLHTSIKDGNFTQKLRIGGRG